MKDSAHELCSFNLIRRPSIDSKHLWELLIKRLISRFRSMKWELETFIGRSLIQYLSQEKTILFELVFKQKMWGVWEGNCAHAPRPKQDSIFQNTSTRKKLEGEDLKSYNKTTKTTKMSEFLRSKQYKTSDDFAFYLSLFPWTGLYFNGIKEFQRKWDV